MTSAAQHGITPFVFPPIVCAADMTVIMRVFSFRHEQFPDITAGNHFLGKNEGGRVSCGMSDHEHFSGLSDARGNGGSFVKIKSHGFFTEDMFSGFQHGNGLFRMEVIGGCDGNDIDFRVGSKFFEIAVNFCGGIQLIFFQAIFASCGVDIAKSLKGIICCIFLEGFDMSESFTHADYGSD